jgi:hypothetical protein
MDLSLIILPMGFPSLVPLAIEAVGILPLRQFAECKAPRQTLIGDSQDRRHETINPKPPPATGNAAVCRRSPRYEKNLKDRLGFRKRCDRFLNLRAQRCEGFCGAFTRPNTVLVTKAYVVPNATKWWVKH